MSDPSGGSLNVAMSWNGDTNTEQWRILTGSDPGSLSVADTVMRDGFETSAVVPSAMYVAVEALDGSANVLARSRTAGGGTLFQESVSAPVNGNYTPLVGDFAGSRNDDVVYYAPGAGLDYLHTSNGDGTFDSRVLPGVNGSYTPVIGDFVGDDRDEILWTAPGSGLAFMWRFDGNARGGAVSIDSAALSVPSTVTTAFVLDHGEIRLTKDEVFFYAAGTSPDSVKHFSWGSTGGISVTSRPVTVNGLYQPITGDFDGNGFDDVFWYRPGPIPDSIWLTEGNSERSTSHRIVETPVSGTYEVVSGNFKGSPERHEIAFHKSGAGTDYLWTFGEDGRYVSEPQTSALAGHAYVLESGKDSVMTWPPGGTTSMWSMDPFSVQPSHNSAVPANYQPLIGDFVGSGGTSSVLWYKAGAAPERLYVRS